MARKRAEDKKANIDSSGKLKSDQSVFRMAPSAAEAASLE